MNESCKRTVENIEETKILYVSDIIFIRFIYLFPYVILKYIHKLKKNTV